jgi:hypothetical protein
MGHPVTLRGAQSNPLFRRSHIEEHIMSLTRFLDMPEVTAKVKPLRPKLPRKINALLHVEPRSNRYTMVGTAFDYLLRFELQRRAPHAIAGKWIAERTPDIIPNIIQYWWESDDGPFSATNDPGAKQYSAWCERNEVSDEELCEELAPYAIKIDKKLSLEDARRLADEAVRLMGSEDESDESVVKLNRELVRFGGSENVGLLEIAARARRVVKKAESAVAAYRKLKRPSSGSRAELAAHAIRLAQLDEVYRAWRLDPGFEEADSDDVDDLLAMLAVVPFDALTDGKLMLLNPDFADSSTLVGGADTDLIRGDMLVDFKVTKRSAMQARDLDQLLGYYLLARHRRRADPTFPAINRAALYFCRHGHLWILEVNNWTNHPEFPDIEEWFFKQASEVCGPSKAARLPTRQES